MENYSWGKFTGWYDVHLFWSSLWNHVPRAIASPEIEAPRKQIARPPTLEFLQSMNRMSLFVSMVSLGVGMISGVAMNLYSAGGMSWFSGGIVFTFALFLWSLVAAVMEFTASSSLGGRRTAYLAIANFIFLMVVLGIVLFSSHGQGSATGASSQTEVSA